MNLLEHFIIHYGYFGLTVTLIGGIVGLPLPDELILTFVGYQVYMGKMGYFLSVLYAFAGSAIGISISYLLGQVLGLPFLKKYGPKIRITERKVEKVQELFQKYGSLLLFIGYFIPGVRHLTGYLAGIAKISFARFALYAYSGALVWVLLFIALGNRLGYNWIIMHQYFITYKAFIIFILFTMAAVIFTYGFKGRQTLFR